MIKNKHARTHIILSFMNIQKTKTQWRLCYVYDVPTPKSLRFQHRLNAVTLSPRLSHLPHHGP